MARFETEVLSQNENLSALTDLSGRWIDVGRSARLTKIVVLDMTAASARPVAIRRVLPTMAISNAPAIICFSCSTGSVILNRACSVPGTSIVPMPSSESRIVPPGRTEEPTPFIAARFLLCREDPVAVPRDGDHRGVVQQAVQDSGGDHRITKHAAPFPGRAVGGDQDLPPLVAPRDQKAHTNRRKSHLACPLHHLPDGR